MLVSLDRESGGICGATYNDAGTEAQRGRKKAIVAHDLEVFAAGETAEKQIDADDGRSQDACCSD